MTDDHLSPGLLVLHGNRLELLAEAVLAWLAAHPLTPLEPEVILVQSNGMAEWLKMELARAHGICAATTLELPARFVWRAYRAVLGRGVVPASSALDKLPLTWRLMQQLPALAGQPGFESVAAFLGAGDGDPVRRLQLAQRLADLFDQYQVYRSDWLQDWSAGDDVLRRASTTAAPPVPADQGWQPALWRALQATLSGEDIAASRARLHQRFVAALRRPAGRAGRAFPDLPRRIVLFGSTHIPHQTLEAVAALAGHCQVLMAVPNPCRYHWADIIDGRELLRLERRRQALRGGRDLAAVPLQDMHAHGHPLLAAWGRQSRDFVRQLDAFDDVQAARQRFDLPRVDLFDEAPGHTLLQQVQAAVRDLLPLAEHPRPAIAAEDHSIVFHVAHSAQREVEILHDQLLRLLARPPGGAALAPRDIVVMVPDIEGFAPAIRSVFGQYARSDPRHIPWGIADQAERGHQPLLVALEWLLRAPQQRFGASQVRDLLDLPAVTLRLGIPPADLPTLAAWVEGAGVRWGLSAAQRAQLGLGAAGEPNTWAFGLRRMLLGYATGALPATEGYAGHEPYAEVAGLQAGLAGALADLVQTLEQWCAEAQVPRRPSAWAERLRSLLGALFRASDDAESALLAALDEALADWLQACETAGFDDVLDLSVLREAWLGAVDAPGAAQRFKAGGVTFCTLLPLRAIPFDVLCLLGMNDGDYPRRASRSDFDLMALPAQARPGDRSRRDDDRQLMLDALLSARRVLYISWAGRSVRDNQEQPPSVLVAQLRDYLAAGWGAAVLASRSTEHPLQPFSRRYFEPAADAELAPLFTYAAEWRAAHGSARVDEPAPASSTEALADAPGLAPLSLQDLATFLRNPVKAFFGHRLRVCFAQPDAAQADDESFGGDGLERWSWVDELLRASSAAVEDQAAAVAPECIRDLVQRQLARLQRAGRLPLAGPGQQVQAALLQALCPALEAWQAVRAEHPLALDRLALRLAHPQQPGLVLDDTLTALRGSAAGRPAWVELQASKLADPGAKTGPALPRVDKLLLAWLRCLATTAIGHPADGIVIGEGAVVRVTATPDAEAARSTLRDLMLACHEGLTGDRPLPTAVKTGWTSLEQPDRAAAVYDGDAAGRRHGEGREPCLARLFPDFASLAADPAFDAASRRLYAPYREWLADHVQVELLGAQAAPEAAGDA